MLFTGENGGATSRGVSSETVRVSVRLVDFPEIDLGPDDGPQRAFTVEPEEVKRTLNALAEFFNRRFQFYGRRLELVYFEGQGDVLAELQGGGQEQAEADAIKVAEEIRPFVELSGITVPYSDALARRAVLNVGVIHMSEQWHLDRRPYTWSPSPDCTFVLRSVADWTVKRVAGRAAAHAGEQLRGQPRSLALIAPDNPWYQDCADAGQRTLEAGGVALRSRIAYKLDFTSLSNQAASLVAKLRADKVTTVLCGCDPLLPLFLTTKAREQGYEPEWIMTGTAFTDLDSVGQLYQQDQWSRAFGLSFSAAPQPARGSLGYFAFKSVRPDEEPADIVDILYSQLYLVALGVQMAGPGLTPASFEAGMRAYPGGSGPMGTWRFSAGRYTPSQDAREVFWDRERVSPMNGKPGAYVETEPGRRYRPGEWPATDPMVFR